MVASSESEQDDCYSSVNYSTRNFAHVRTYIQQRHAYFVHTIIIAALTDRSGYRTVRKSVSSHERARAMTWSYPAQLYKLITN